MLAAVFDLLFAPGCAACDQPLTGAGARALPLCAVCAISLYPLDSACPRCAEPLEGPVNLLCRRCRTRPPPFASAHAPYRYGGELARALRRLKYQRRADIARALAPLLAPRLREVVARCEIEVAVPVPLHWRRASQRGFNQAALLLRQAARGSRLPIDALSLRRQRATVTQRHLRGGEREANVRGAFAVVARRQRHIAGRRVLCVDDIMTTGATMAAAARALRAAGAREVVAFCAARAER
ncbi:ComF family protein [Haliangium ochraceum]|uniref:Competence protein F, putative n=1 Tax=Haliangium ochraceum (strain DSM 14365 / JCM 11303 / SMP-2) TaxID=502025 RepID=D0LXX0_HALO1|nr:phosphoribosyltransferase family protein [Haliangium ochraceum]ACY14325.1 competence protein F, putative [Haliangium ochraceum DSM 14365]